MYYDVVLWVGGWGGDNGIPGCEGWVLNITSKPCHWMVYTCVCFKTHLYCYKVVRARELNIVPNRKDLVCPPLTKKASL